MLSTGSHSLFTPLCHTLKDDFPPTPMSLLSPVGKQVVAGQPAPEKFKTLHSTQHGWWYRSHPSASPAAAESHLYPKHHASSRTKHILSNTCTADLILATFGYYLAHPALQTPQHLMQWALLMCMVALFFSSSCHLLRSIFFQPSTWTWCCGQLPLQFSESSALHPAALSLSFTLWQMPGNCLVLCHRKPRILNLHQANKSIAKEVRCYLQTEEGADISLNTWGESGFLLFLITISQTEGKQLAFAFEKRPRGLDRARGMMLEMSPFQISLKPCVPQVQRCRSPASAASHSLSPKAQLSKN